jgi:hypothetical protein
MKEFYIKITDAEVYINDELCKFTYAMDKDDKEDDLNKKAILALANQMGYEATYLFEEMAGRIHTILDEIEEEFKMNETVKIWIEELGNPTKEEIKAEIEEVKGTISNEKLWALSDDIHYENIKVLEEYLEVLEDMLSR